MKLKEAKVAEYITTRDMRRLLETGGRLQLGTEATGKLARGEYGKEQPDIQWLYDCAMEKGNSGKVPCYADLVEAAERILREAKDLGREWFASNAEVMAWSSLDDRGVSTPDRFRVTLDMVTKDMEAPTDEDV